MKQNKRDAKRVMKYARKYGGSEIERRKSNFWNIFVATLTAL
jgi:hypothetical protein